MAPYWLLFLFFAVGALLSSRGLTAAPPVPAATGRGPAGRPNLQRPPTDLLFGLGMIFVTVMIGLRWQVGGDWINYLGIFKKAAYWLPSQGFGRNEPAYQVLNWAVASLGGAVWWVNLVCALIFVWGLQRLARLQPEPWLAVVVAIPYLIVVVAMGYTRQAAALGLIMVGLSGVLRGKGIVQFAIYVGLAALFHRTAIVILPLMAFVFPRSRLTDLFVILGLTAAFYVLLLQESVTVLSRNYLEARYSSQGAAIRVAQLALAGVVFLFGSKAMRFTDRERRLWRNFAVVSLLLIPILLLSPSSTAVDRLSLYLLPIQFIVLSRLPLWISPPPLARLLVITYSAAVLFVWLNYAVNARGWLPYQNVLFN